MFVVFVPNDESTHAKLTLTLVFYCNVNVISIVHHWSYRDLNAGDVVLSRILAS